MSAYLETRPRPGRPRRPGADVSHAWASVFVPDVGWVDVDPTNDQFVNDRYVVTAWGRDYGDISPLKGVIFTEGSGHSLEVSVDMISSRTNGSGHRSWRRTRVVNSDAFVPMSGVRPARFSSRTAMTVDLLQGWTNLPRDRPNGSRSAPRFARPKSRFPERQRTEIAGRLCG